MSEEKPRRKRGPRRTVKDELAAVDKRIQRHRDAIAKLNTKRLELVDQAKRAAQELLDQAGIEYGTLATSMPDGEPGSSPDNPRHGLRPARVVGQAPRRTPNDAPF